MFPFHKPDDDNDQPVTLIPKKSFALLLAKVAKEHEATRIQREHQLQELLRRADNLPAKLDPEADAAFYAWDRDWRSSGLHEWGPVIDERDFRSQNSWLAATEGRCRFSPLYQPVNLKATRERESAQHQRELSDPKTVAWYIAYAEDCRKLGEELLACHHYLNHVPREQWPGNKRKSGDAGADTPKWELSVETSGAILSRLETGPSDGERFTLVSRSKVRWAGTVLVDLVHLNEDDAKATLAAWVERGVLKQTDYMRPTRHMAKGIEVVQPRPTVLYVVKHAQENVSVDEESDQADD